MIGPRPICAPTLDLRRICVDCAEPAVVQLPDPRCLRHAEYFYQDLVRIGAALAALQHVAPSTVEWLY